MKEILKLKNPIMIDGERVSELTYDADEITGLLFAEAEAKHRAVVQSATMTPAAEFDFGLHLFLGYAAIIAVHEAPKGGSVAFEDLQRIKGKDVVAVMRIGRNFILVSEKAQQESDSDAPAETLPASTTPASGSLKEKE